MNKSSVCLIAEWVIVCTFFMLITQCPSCAQITISPTIIDDSAYRGTSKRISIGLHNSGKEPLACTARPVSFTVTAEGLPVEVESAPRSCAGWMKLTPSEFTLSPGEGKTTIVEIVVPKDAGGGYYGIVSFHGIPQGPAEMTGEGRVRAGIRFSHKVMAVVMLTVPASEMRAVIEAAQPIVEELPDSHGYRFALPIRNLGNIHTQMGGKVDVMSEDGQKVEQFLLTAGRGYLLPGHERVFRKRGTVNLPDGVYLAKVQLFEAKGAAPMSKAFGFFVDQGVPKVEEISEEVRKRLEGQATGFTVSPAETQFDLRPGARRMDAVTIANLTRETIPLEMKVMEWVRQADGADHVLPGKPEHGRSVVECITLRLDAMQLRPLGKTRIPITLTLPEGFSGEGYAAVVFDRADRELTDAPDQVARRSTRIRALASRTGQAAVELLSFTAQRAPNGVIEFLAPIANRGDMGIFPDVSLSIQNIENTEVGRITLPDLRNSLVQAGAERLIRSEYRKILDPGSYTALLTIRYGDGSHFLSGRASFVVPESKPEEGETAQESVLSASDSQN